MDQISRTMESLKIIDINDDNLTELEEILEYEFNNRNLLLEAITHSSMKDTKSYERLEFLGDSVLGYLVTKHLHCTHPEHDEGTLTLLRSRNVLNEKLARVCVKHKFHEYLHLNQPDPKSLIDKFVKAIEDESESESKPPKVLAGIVESIAGAVWVDSGHCVDKVWEVFKPLLEPLATLETLREEHPTTELKELCQKHGKHLEYKYSWPGNIVTVKVRINHKVVGIGEHQQEELAQRTAEKRAVEELQDMLKEADRVEKARRDEKGSNGYLIALCRKKDWLPPSYRCVKEISSHTRRFLYAARVCREDGWTEEYVGNPMPRIKDAKNSAAKAVLDVLNVN